MQKCRKVEMQKYRKGEKKVEMQICRNVENKKMQLGQSSQSKQISKPIRAI